MRCPSCGDEYEPHATHCASCRVELVPDHAPPPPPRADALLGTFHPVLAERIAGLLSGRGIPHEAIAVGDNDVEVLIAADFRNDLRAELAVNWQEFVRRVPRDVLDGLLAEGESMPGWRDAPTSAWVDRDGRLRMAATEDEEADDDANRVLGPGLVVAGLLLVVLGWVADDSLQSFLILIGVGSAALGLLLPR